MLMKGCPSRQSACCGIIFLTVLCVCAQDSNRAEIDRLVPLLGSTKFAERDAAERRLEAIGEPALPALRRAMKDSGSPEIRRRAGELVEKILTRRILHGPNRPKTDILSLTFTTDGKRVLSGSTQVLVWDIASRKNLHQLKPKTNNDRYVHALAVTPDGRLALTGESYTARLYDVETGEEVRRLDKDGKTISAVAFTPDGKWALAYNGMSVQRWELERGIEPGPSGWEVDELMEGTCGAFSPDTRRLVTGKGARIDLWDVATGKRLGRFTGHHDDVWGLAFTPDGRRVVSAARDASTRLWDADSGEELLRFDGHRSWVICVAVSPDGRRVLSGDDSGVVCLWDLESGREIRRWKEHPTGIRSLAFSPDHTWAASGGQDGTVRLLNLTE